MIPNLAIGYIGPYHKMAVNQMTFDRGQNARKGIWNIDLLIATVLGEF